VRNHAGIESLADKPASMFTEKNLQFVRPRDRCRSRGDQVYMGPGPRGSRCGRGARRGLCDLATNGRCLLERRRVR
jgi:hypothetical protein